MLTHVLPGQNPFHHLGRIGRGMIIKAVRQTDIAIIKPEDPVSGGGEALPEKIRPSCHLGAEPHHEDDRFTGLRPNLVIFKLKPPGGYSWHHYPFWLSVCAPAPSARDLKLFSCVPRSIR